MAFQLKQLAPLPRLCCILLLLSTISSSHAKEKSCKCPGSVNDRRSNYAMADAGAVYLINNHSGLVQKPYHKIPHTKSNKTRVLSTIDGLIKLCQSRPDGSGVDESSFNITIVMRNQTTPGNRSVFSLLILPGEALAFREVNDSLPLAQQLVAVTNTGYPLNFSKPTYGMGPLSDGHVKTATGMLGNPVRTGHDNGRRAMGVDVIIRPAASNYSVWIDYDSVGRLSVYVDLEGKPKPASAIAEAPFNISKVVSPTSPFVYFGLLTRLEQRRRNRGIHFSATVEDLSDYPVNSHDRRSNYAMADAGAVYLINNHSGLVQKPYHEIPHTKSNKTRVLSTIDGLIKLCQSRPDGSGFDVSSFNITIVMRNQRIPEKRSVLSLLILPGEALAFREVNDSLPLAEQLMAVTNTGYPLNFSKPTYGMGPLPDGHVKTATGMLGSPVRTGHDNGRRAMGVDVIIRPAASNYSVWIDYDRVGVGRLSVYVDLEGKPKPASAIAEAPFNISKVVSPTSPFVYFGLLTRLEQRRRNRGIHFSATVEDLPDYPVKGGFMSKRMTILSSILGSVATTTVMAVAVMCYFNSRYRRWHKELNQLAKSMERLPGVPTKVEFAEINKATCNFHESMKLGGGGFGTVYRCTLPAAASKTERPMDVAVKRFTREVQNRRYDDFLAEVSIINRLRHKNIVPLVGWSYNKGEPLLVFEYMTNGSLDQHLFPKGGASLSSSRNGQRCTGAAIRRWATRYEIVRDIATGLHYVHHEYEPMVLHRDIKASNVMLDSSFRARLGDFGLACTVAVNRNSATGVAGTWGYIAPEYAICGKATRQTDIYALGVLILELVTGKRALDDDYVVNSDDMHITDWVWRLHCEGRLRECVDDIVLAVSSEEDEEEHVDVGEDAARLLLLGLACSNPNPSDRPTMPDVVQVIAKSAPPPEVPLQKPSFVWPPPGGLASDDDSTFSSTMSDLDSSTDAQQVSLGQPIVHVRTARRYYASFQLQAS